MVGTVTSKSARLTVNPHARKTHSTNFPLSENPISEQEDLDEWWDRRP
jgi:hypothetical protein